MSRKDYERAAEIAQRGPAYAQWYAIDAFVELFRDSPGFDEARFRAACVLGASVRARRRPATWREASEA